MGEEGGQIKWREAPRPPCQRVFKALRATPKPDGEEKGKGEKEGSRKEAPKPRVAKALKATPGPDKRRGIKKRTNGIKTKKMIDEEKLSSL